MLGTMLGTMGVRVRVAAALALLAQLLCLVPAAEPAASCAREHDWLVAADDSAARARATLEPGQGGITLSNGLVERSFVTSPSFGTTDLKNLKTGDSALRHIVPEAALTLDGQHYTLGGLFMADEPSPTGEQYQGQHAFLNRTGLATRLRVRPNAWTYAEHRLSAPEADLPWVPGRRHSPTTVAWPPRVSTRMRRAVLPCPTTDGRPAYDALALALALARAPLRGTLHERGSTHAPCCVCVCVCVCARAPLHVARGSGSRSGSRPRKAARTSSKA